MSWSSHEWHDIFELDPGDRLAAHAICKTCNIRLIQTLHPIEYIVIDVPGAFLASVKTEYPKDGPVVVEEMNLVDMGGKPLGVYSPEEHGVIDYNDLPVKT